MTQLGIAHVAGLYHINNGPGGFMEDGRDFITDTIGATCIELWMGPSYLSWYNEVWGGVPVNLTQMAGFTPLSTVLADAAIDTYVLKAFTWNDNGIDAWKFATTNRDTYYAAEYAEIRDLAEHLLTTYAGTGKTFVLQTSESDWPLCDADKTAHVDHQRTQWLAGWARVRQNAVEDARRAVPADDVRVFNALECNLVYQCLDDPDINRISNKVLRRIKPDYVSYSPYETIVDPDGPPYWYGSEAAMITAITANLTNCLQEIKRQAPDTGLYIGEWGYPEHDIDAGPGYDVTNLIDATWSVWTAQEMIWAVYWQVWCNETDGVGGHRGYHCQEDDGSTTAAGTQLITYT